MYSLYHDIIQAKEMKKKTMNRNQTDSGQVEDADNGLSAQNDILCLHNLVLHLVTGRHGKHTGSHLNFLRVYTVLSVEFSVFLS